MEIGNALKTIIQQKMMKQLSWNFPVGLNKENKQVYVYYQICPSCKDAIVGIKTPKEGSFICYPNDTEGLILLHK